MVCEKAPTGAVITGYDLPDFDITDRLMVLEVLGRLRPDIIINCAAFTDVDGCESNQELSMAVNGMGAGFLAEAALQVGAILVHLSTDYVFDGCSSKPYLEDDVPAPQSAYGRSKLAGETRILDSGLEKYFIIRTSWLYGPGGNNFVETVIRLAEEREELRIVADQFGSPTYTADLADGIMALLEVALDPQRTTLNRGLYGIYHFTNSGECSWYDFAVEIVSRVKSSGRQVKVERIKPIATADYPLPAKRPAYSVLSKEKYHAATGKDIPDWQSGLSRYLALRNGGIFDKSIKE
jgi:dTDP-4-dehydrorhamnose reductase